jgi:hypothetical protein
VTSIHAVKRPMATPSAKNGTRASATRRTGRATPASAGHGRHHATAAIATGTATAVVLESIASTKRTKAAAACRPAPRVPAGAESQRTQASIAPSANAIDRTFLRSVIHATLSTCIGCSAKRVAAIPAPASPSARSRRQRRNADSPCRSTFTRW